MSLELRLLSIKPKNKLKFLHSKKKFEKENIMNVRQKGQLARQKGNKGIHLARQKGQLWQARTNSEERDLPLIQK